MGRAGKASTKRTLIVFSQCCVNVEREKEIVKNCQKEEREREREREREGALDKCNGYTTTHPFY